MIFMPNDWNWRSILSDEFRKPSYLQLCNKIADDRKKGIAVYPGDWVLFRALDLCSPYMVKVVIVGQDPYHTKDVANGLAFGTSMSVKELPPSLRNIARALKLDLGIEMKNGDLSGWAQQGVLLLNTILTVEAGKPLSHAGLGWESVTDKILTYLNSSAAPIVFCLWGKKAQEKKALLDNPNHLIIESSHPSPFSVNQGFLWHKPFSKVNEYFKERHMRGVSWDVWF